MRKLLIIPAMLFMSATSFGDIAVNITDVDEFFTQANLFYDKANELLKCATNLRDLKNSNQDFTLDVPPDSQSLVHVRTRAQLSIYAALKSEITSDAIKLP